jgi:L-malate glycosyltransferase
MKQPRIIHITHSLEIGGLERVVLDLARGFRSKGHGVSLCCLDRKGELGEMAESEGFEVFSLGKKAGVDYQLPLRIRKIIKEWDFDIVHTHNEAGLVYGVPAALLSGRCNIVHTEHGKEPEYLGKKRLHAVERFLWSKVDHRVAVSEALRDEVCKNLKIEVERVLVIRNGIEVKKFVHPEGRLERRKALGIDKNSFVIGNVARLVHLKNHNFLLDVFREIEKEVSNIRLVVIGGGPLLEELKEHACKLGLSNSAVFLGERIDVEDLLCVFDLFALPSFTEGISITLLEAMAAGLPVVASDVGGNPEIVENDRTGLLIPVNNVSAWVHGIKMLIEDRQKREAFSVVGRTRVRQKFSLEAMLEGYGGIYGKRGF